MFCKSIGTATGFARDIFRKHGLTPFRQVLPPAAFQEAFPGPPPRNSTILIPEVVFWLMASVAFAEGPASMTAAVSSFWAILRTNLPFLHAKPITEEAFCTARNALSLFSFKLLFFRLLMRFEQAQGDRFRWKGFRLRAIDGMDFDLPQHPTLYRAFPPLSNSHKTRARPQARLVGLVGLWDGICYDFCVKPLRVSEQVCARRLISGLRPGDLLLADRNFPDYETFGGLALRNVDFLFHLASNRYHKLPHEATPSGRTDEWHVTLKLPADLRKQHPEFPSTLRVRILKYQIKGYRPSRLITSLLDSEVYSYEEVVGLYHERWRQETAHANWKYTLQLSNLRSHTPRGIGKELYVHLLMNNTIRWIMADATQQDQPPGCDPSRAGLRPVDLKFPEAKRLILATIPAMTTAPAAKLPLLYKQLLRDIAKELILVRPGRNYPRRFDHTVRDKGGGERKQPARLTAEPLAGYVLV